MSVFPRVENLPEPKECGCHPSQQQLAVVFPHTSYVCLTCGGVKE